MAGTKVTPEQFEIQNSAVLHTPTGARFFAYPEQSHFSNVNWGRAAEVLPSGDDYRREDVQAMAEKLWSQRTFNKDCPRHGPCKIQEFCTSKRPTIKKGFSGAEYRGGIPLGLVLADRRQRLPEQRHPGIEDVLENRRERSLVTVFRRDDDLLGATVFALAPAHFTPAAADRDHVG